MTHYNCPNSIRKKNFMCTQMNFILKWCLCLLKISTTNVTNPLHMLLGCWTRWNEIATQWSESITM
jgi:hypothetical protein